MKLHLTRLQIIRGLAVLLVLAGLAGLIPLNYFAFKSKEAVAAQSGVPVKAPALPASPTLVTGEPVAISIPSLKMNLTVIPGVYNPNNGKWTLTLSEAQFATPSVQPNNETGNTLIYGHYRKAVFAYLHLIKPGAQAIVTTSNGYAFSYTFESTQPLDPTDTSIFTYQGPPRLTVQTCSGSLFQHRQMYYFKYDGYTKV